MTRAKVRKQRSPPVYGRDVHKVTTGISSSRPAGAGGTSGPIAPRAGGIPAKLHADPGGSSRPITSRVGGIHTELPAGAGAPIGPSLPRAGGMSSRLPPDAVRGSGLSSQTASEQALIAETHGEASRDDLGSDLGVGIPEGQIGASNSTGGWLRRILWGGFVDRQREKEN